MELTRSAAGVLVVIGVTAGAGATYYLAHTTPEPTAEARVEVPAASARPVPLATEAGAAKALRRAGTVGAPIPKASEPAVPDTAVPVNTSAKAAAAVVPESAPEARAPRVTEPEEPKAPLFAEFVIEPDTVFGVQFDGTVSSDTAAVEDAVAARVTRDVRVGDQVVVPAGARIYGEVSLVERGGKLRDRSRIGVRFTSVTAANGERVPITTDVVLRDGESPAPASAAKIGGGAVGGAIIGGLLGGGKGAAIGSTIGASAGTAVVMTGDRKAAVFAAATPVTVRLTRAATVTFDR